MFNKKSEKVDKTISNLEKRICNLENPYLFNIGDYVSSSCYNFSEGENIINFGTIVSQSYEYKDEKYGIISYLRLSPLYDRDPVYKRFNTYLVYHESENKTVSYSESELKLSNKKK